MVGRFILTSFGSSTAIAVGASARNRLKVVASSLLHPLSSNCKFAPQREEDNLQVRCREQHLYTNRRVDGPHRMARPE